MYFYIQTQHTKRTRLYTCLLHKNIEKNVKQRSQPVVRDCVYIYLLFKYFETN